MNCAGHVASCFLVELRAKRKGSKARPFCFWELRMLEYGKQSDIASQFPSLAFTLLRGKVRGNPRKEQPQIPYLTKMQIAPHPRAAYINLLRADTLALMNGFPKLLHGNQVFPQHPTPIPWGTRS